MKTSPAARQLHALWLGNASTADLHTAFSRLLHDCAQADVALAKAEALLADVEQLRARMMRAALADIEEARKRLISAPLGAAQHAVDSPVAESPRPAGGDLISPTPTGDAVV